MVQGPSISTVPERISRAAGSNNISLPSRDELDDDAIYDELTWALESNDEGPFDAGIDWSDDDGEKVYTKDEDRDVVESDTEPSQVLTEEELGKSGRR